MRHFTNLAVNHELNQIGNPSPSRLCHHTDHRELVCSECGVRRRLIEVALCEDCGGCSEWHQVDAHPWHRRLCSFCGSERISRVETDQRNLRDVALEPKREESSH